MPPKREKKGSIEQLLPVDNIEDIYPMSDIQKGMIYHTLKNPAASHYHNQIVIMRHSPAFDPGRFQQTVRLVTDKHPMMRTVFNMYDYEEPIQIVLKKYDPDVKYHDISHLDKKEQEQYIHRELAEDRAKSFDFSRLVPLWRIRIFDVGKEMICITWICHHSIIDGWSFASLMTEINNTYNHLKFEPGLILQKLKYTYKDFIIEQLEEKKKIRNREFWKKELQDYKRIHLLKPLENSGNSYEIQVFYRDMGKQLRQQLEIKAREYNTSLRALCFSAYVYMVNMLSFENDVIVGYVTHNRPDIKDAEKIIGCFLNLVPVRIKIPPQLRWLDFVQLVENKLQVLKRYDKISLFEIKRITNPKNITEELFEFNFNLVDFHVFNQLEPLHSPGETPSPDKQGLNIAGSGSTNILFDAIVHTDSGEFKLTFTYAVPTISPKIVGLLYDYYQDALKKMVYEPGSLLSKEKKLVSDSSQTNFNTASSQAKTGKIEFNF